MYRYIVKNQDPAGPIADSDAKKTDENYWINQAENDPGITPSLGAMSSWDVANRAKTFVQSGQVDKGGTATSSAGSVENITKDAPIDYYNNYNNVINLNSNRYRGLGKRRRLRDDLRRAGKDALVWNGAEAQRATNFLSGNRFSARDARNAIRNGRQNAYTFDANKFQQGSIERDANTRMNDYFSQHPNAINAAWNHGTWQRQVPVQPEMINVQDTSTTPAGDWEKRYNELKARLDLLEKGASTQNPNNTTNPTRTETGTRTGTGTRTETRTRTEMFNRFAKLLNLNTNQTYDENNPNFIKAIKYRFGQNAQLMFDTKGNPYIQNGNVRYFSSGRSQNSDGKYFNTWDEGSRYQTLFGTAKERFSGQYNSDYWNDKYSQRDRKRYEYLINQLNSINGVAEQRNYINLHPELNNHFKYNYLTKKYTLI